MPSAYISFLTASKMRISYTLRVRELISEPAGEALPYIYFKSQKALPSSQDT